MSIRPASAYAEQEQQLAEMASNLEAVMLENETLTKIISADLQLAAAHAVIQQLTKEVEVLRERNAGLMTEKNDAIRSARNANRAASRAEKASS